MGITLSRAIFYSCVITGLTISFNVVAQAPLAQASVPATVNSGQAAKTPLPPDWLSRELAKPVRLQGEGLLRVFGFQIYQAKLWVTGPTFSYDADFALDLTYKQAVDKEGLVLATVPALSIMAEQTSTKLDFWAKELRRVYPDIVPGDRLIAVWRRDAAVTRFFLNDKPVGEIAGADFAKAFFSIWLDPRTKRPELRRELLNEAAPKAKPAAKPR